MEKNQQKNIITPRRMVKIDEDEEECLRRLAEPTTATTTTTTTTTTRSSSSHHHHKVIKKNVTNYSNNNNKKKVTQDIHIIADHDHDHYYAHEEKKVVTQMPSKEIKVIPNNNKLETKKSEDINESAEKFIQKFKQQLILQRLESIENVEKMLERGR